MNRTVKISEKNSETTSLPKKYLSKIHQVKQSKLDSYKRPQHMVKAFSNSINNSSAIKKIQINLGMRPSRYEGESVGEEGAPQLIRSPIVKRGRSMSHSMHIIQEDDSINHSMHFQVPALGIMGISNSKHSQEDDPMSHSMNIQESDLSSMNIISNNEPIQELYLEIDTLRTKIDAQSEQISIYQKTILDLSTKYEFSRTEIIEQEEKITKILIENRKLNEENEKLISMLRFLEGDQNSISSKGYLQEALEAKLLSIDHDREEKAENYNLVLFKYISHLEEFLAMQDWTLSLLYAPYPKKDLLDNEDSIKNRIDRLQAEIIYYHSQLKSEIIIEKSYCTSLSSSILQSASCSPTKTMKNETMQDILIPKASLSPN